MRIRNGDTVGMVSKGRGRSGCGMLGRIVGGEVGLWGVGWYNDISYSSFYIHIT